MLWHWPPRLALLKPVMYLSPLTFPYLHNLPPLLLNYTYYLFHDHQQDNRDVLFNSWKSFRRMWKGSSNCMNTTLSVRVTRAVVWNGRLVSCEREKEREGERERKRETEKDTAENCWVRTDMMKGRDSRRQRERVRFLNQHSPWSGLLWWAPYIRDTARRTSPSSPSCRRADHPSRSTSGRGRCCTHNTCVGNQTRNQCLWLRMISYKASKEWGPTQSSMNGI